jgi:hypothetical protein
MAQSHVSKDPSNQLSLTFAYDFHVNLSCLGDNEYQVICIECMERKMV